MYLFIMAVIGLCTSFKVPKKVIKIGSSGGVTISAEELKRQNCPGFDTFIPGVGAIVVGARTRSA
jgi:hypothetical protein